MPVHLLRRSFLFLKLGKFFLPVEYLSFSSTILFRNKHLWKQLEL